MTTTETRTPRTANPLPLRGRTAVVNGVGGAGADLARLLVADGAAVALLDTRVTVIADLVDELADRGTSMGVAVDAHDPVAVRDAAETVRRRLGDVDLVVETAPRGRLRAAAMFAGDLVAAAVRHAPADLVHVVGDGAQLDAVVELSALGVRITAVGPGSSASDVVRAVARPVRASRG